LPAATSAALVMEVAASVAAAKIVKIDRRMLASSMKDDRSAAM
jgi:hypothetical protein